MLVSSPYPPTLYVTRKGDGLSLDVATEASVYTSLPFL